MSREKETARIRTNEQNAKNIRIATTKTKVASAHNKIHIACVFVISTHAMYARYGIYG